MAEIRSIEDCFDYHGEITKVLTGITDFTSKLSSERKNLSNNDQYYGTKTFSCGNYVPIKTKMKAIDADILLVINDLKDTYKGIKTCFYNKAVNDLNQLIDYCDQKINKYEQMKAEIARNQKKSPATDGNILPNFNKESTISFETVISSADKTAYELGIKNKVIAQKKLKQIEIEYNGTTGEEIFA